MKIFMLAGTLYAQFVPERLEMHGTPLAAGWVNWTPQQIAEAFRLT